MTRTRALLASVVVLVCTALAASAGAQDTEPGTEPADEALPAPEQTEGAPEEVVATSESPPSEIPIVPQPSEDESEQLAQQLRLRNDFVAVHRAFGIATWASMAATAVFGWIQFADEYGFHGNANETACANGNAVFQDFCSPNIPWVHSILGFTTAALYFTTFGISFAIPAPLEASADVELHKTLRWFHLASILATAVFGVVTANIQTNDFALQQGLAITHQVLALTTFGLLTAAAAVVLF